MTCGEVEQIEGGRLTSQYDAETHVLSRWKLKQPRPRQSTLPSKQPRSAITTIVLEPPEDMRSMEVWGDAIVLTGL